MVLACNLLNSYLKAFVDADRYEKMVMIALCHQTFDLIYHTRASQKNYILIFFYYCQLKTTIIYAYQFN